jgi:hypothetical protein
MITAPRDRTSIGLMTDAAVEGLARNEALFREVNERIRTVASGDAAAHYDFVCECADPGCTQRVSLTLAEYEHVRSNAVRFLLAPGHVVSAIEHVVEREEGYDVVAKSGAAAEVARELDPREGGQRDHATEPE